jgi:hypothetical protein
MNRWRGRVVTLAFWLGVGLLFALAYSQDPLFSSNQNQYFLHGLAGAGLGHLNHDWLANTRDPTPVFSFLVQATYAWPGPWAYYLEYGLLLCLYIWGLYSLAASALGPAPSRLERFWLIAGLIFLHSSALRFLLARLPVGDGGYLLEGGVAGQRLLGPVFQPSAFGALLVVSMTLFLRGHPHWASAVAAAAATVHPTYLLTAGTLVFGTLLVLAFLDHLPGRAAASGALALAIVIPILVYTLQLWAGSSAQTSAEAASVLVNFRIPHHAVLPQWLGASSVLKVGLIAAVLAACWRRRIFWLLAAPAGAGALLTIAQVVSGNDQLALIFPWRVSTLLVPVSLAWLLGLALAWIAGRLSSRKSLQRWGAWLAWPLIIALAAGGLVAFGLRLERQLRDPASRLFDQVRRLAAPDQIYLIPPGLEQFRLATGEPAFIDFKSIPYQPGEVLEWYDRVRLAQFFYRDQAADVPCSLLDRAAVAGVTHVVLEPPQQAAACPQLTQLWQGQGYAIFRLGGGPDDRVQSGDVTIPAP